MELPFSFIAIASLTCIHNVFVNVDKITALARGSIFMSRICVLKYSVFSEDSQLFWFQNASFK